ARPTATHHSRGIGSSAAGLKQSQPMTKDDGNSPFKSTRQQAQSRLRYFEQHRDQIVDTIVRLVELESPSDNKPAVDRCSVFAAAESAALAGHAHVHRVNAYGK